MVAPLDQFLKSNDRIKIWTAALELEQVEGCRAVKRIVRAMIRALKDPDSERRQAAARVLGWIARPTHHAVDALIGALADPEADVREEAAESLGYRHARRSIRPLIEALRDPAANVRFFAAFALGSLQIPRGRRDTRIAPALESMLSDSETPPGNWWPVRLEALAALNDERFKHELSRVMNNPNSSAAERRWAERYRDEPPTEDASKCRPEP